MRISSQQIFTNGLNRLQDVNAQLNKTQQQISSGRKFLSPSDDPVAAARVLQLDQLIAQNTQYQRNVDLAQSRLEREEATLTDITRIIERVRELSVQAGNGSLSPADRATLSAELEERVEQLANLMNTKDASGEYIFSGFKGKQAAFEQNVSGNWVYKGDEGQRFLDIDVSVRVAISDNGKNLFVDVPSNQPTFFTEAGPNNGGVPPAQISTGMVVDQAAFNDFFPRDMVVTIEDVGAGNFEYVVTERQTGRELQRDAFVSGEPIEVRGIQFEVIGSPVDGDQFFVKTSQKQGLLTTVEKLVYGLNNIPKTDDDGRAAYDALIAESLENLDNALENILRVQTQIGGRLNAVDSTREFLKDSSVFAEKTRSNLRDVDYTEAVSRLSFQSFVLEAAQLSYAQVSRLSLFDRL